MKKFIIFIGYYGPSTQIMGLYSALYIANITDRILIDPFIYSHDKSPDIPLSITKLSDIFDSKIVWPKGE